MRRRGRSPTPLPNRVHLGLVEVGVAVDEEQAKAPPATQRQHRAEQDRAVTAEYDRELATIDQLSNSLGEQRRVSGERLRVHDLGLRIAVGAVARRLDAACRASGKSIRQARFEQELWCAFDTQVLRNVAERRGRF